MLDRYRTKIDCVDDTCVIRYYDINMSMAVGIIRTKRIISKKMTNVNVIITSMNISRMVEDLIMDVDLSPDLISNEIKLDATERIKEYVSAPFQDLC